jgi:hypothetical protein
MNRATYKYDGPRENDRTLTIDDETALWLARMLVGEGGNGISKGEASAMLWAMLNRWFLHPGRRYWPTFLTLLRRFSQPINPRHMRGGDICERERKKGNPMYSDKRLDRRERVSHLRPDEIPLRLRVFLRGFVEGKVFPPDALAELDKPRISNWASYGGLRKRYPWGIDFGTKNWFFEDRNLIKGCVIVR